LKKLFFLLLAATAVFSLAACGNTEPEGFTIAMITDAGDIDDESFNQGTWEGIVEYAEENGITHKYYRPAQISDAAYLDTIRLAVEGGAEIIVTPGFLFEPAVYEAQTEFPDVRFVLIDGVPHPGDWTTFEVADNTVSILFDEHESGFLAGYAAVMDGYRDLGFMGGIAVPAVVRFGIGFVAGAHYAAQELDVEISIPDNRFEYLGNFDASDEHKTRALAWFEDGTEIIFAAAGGAGSSVMAAAEDAEAMAIGVDVDQGYISETVLTSAMKDLGSAVQQALANHFGDTFQGGEIIQMNSTNDGVALPMETSRFETFTQAQYDAIFAELINIEIPTNEEELELFLEGLVPATRVEDILTMEVDTPLTIEAVVIGTDSFRTFYIADATGAIAVFDIARDFIVDLEIGDLVSLSGIRGEFNGLLQITSPTLEVLESGVDLPLEAALLNDADFNDLLPLQARQINLTGFTIDDIEYDRFNNITFTLTNGDNTINFRFDSRATLGESFELAMDDIENGMTVNITGALLAWFNGPQLTFNVGMTITVE
jgi:basic membrane protein A